MHILVLYATVEGQTGKIARFVTEHLSERRCAVTSVNIEAWDPVSIETYDAVILAGSVHQRRHSDRFEAMIRHHRDTFARMHTLLLSVSLSAAFPEGQEDARDFLTEMKMRTGFMPTDELLVAGAVRSDAYDAFSKSVIRNVVLRNQNVDLSRDRHEFTDWAALSEKLDTFIPAEVPHRCAV